MDTDAGKDFFISYTHADTKWAEWIAWQLEEAGYSTILQAWDFRPGSNFVAEMDRAAQSSERTILVLSPAYVQSEYTFAEWAARFRRDPKGTQNLLLPIRIQPCDVEGLLGPIVYIDLVGCDEQEAHERLLAGVPRERVKPASVAFPVSLVQAPEQPAFPAPLPTIWTIPYPHNPVFTGRQDILTLLANILKSGQPTALSQAQAISGLGGIGKTQIAVEYAYQHQQDYQAVLWVRAQTREELISGYVALAKVLQLPEQQEPNQMLIVQAVMRWLSTQAGWLLILDNADDLFLAKEFLPARWSGHILLTTRAESMGRVAQRVEVETMPPDVGALFLLRRASLLAPDAPVEQAEAAALASAHELCEALGGLPLALDQAGAYCEETHCDFSQYLQHYRTHRSVLLQRRGGIISDHPEPVATTWSLSFEKVEQANPAAAEVLRLCVFLAPDAIPEALLTQGARHLGPILATVAEDSMALDEAMAVVGAYSLVQRNPAAHTLRVHRLVQAVLIERMDQHTQHLWLERTIRALEEAFPQSGEFENWETCSLYLSHVLVAFSYLKTEKLLLPQAAVVLRRAGWYLAERGQYSEAEELLQYAFELRGQSEDSDDLMIAIVAITLGWLYVKEGKYEQAEPLYQRALAIDEKAYGPEHHEVAADLHNLAGLYREQGKYEQAEPLYQRALAIWEQQLGPEHPYTARSLHNLAGLYREQGKYEQAEPLYQRALAIWEQQLGPEHPHTAIGLSSLAGLYHTQGKYEQAEPLLKRALAIVEQQLGPEHPHTATIRENYHALIRDMQHKGKR